MTFVIASLLSLLGFFLISGFSLTLAHLALSVIIGALIAGILTLERHLSGLDDRMGIDDSHYYRF